MLDIARVVQIKWCQMRKACQQQCEDSNLTYEDIVIGNCMLDRIIWNPLEKCSVEAVGIMTLQIIALKILHLEGYDVQ